jgi:hypothetical protein
VGSGSAVAVAVGSSVAVGSAVGSGVSVGAGSRDSVVGVSAGSVVGLSAVSSGTVPAPPEQALRVIISNKMLKSSFFIIKPPFSTGAKIIFIVERIYDVVYV